MTREQRWLDLVIETWSTFQFPPDAIQPKVAEVIRVLCSDVPEAVSIRAWLQEQNKGKTAHPMGYSEPIGYHGPKLTTPLACDQWEADLLWLAYFFVQEPDTSAWDLADKESRHSHAKKVANRARALADALDEPVRPEYPPVLALLEEADALALAKVTPSLFRWVTGDNIPQPPPLDTAPARLAFHLAAPDGAQQLPGILRRLADFAEASVNRKALVARPSTGNAGARAFACKLHMYLVENYGQPFDRINAECVALKYRDAEERPSEEHIRKWTGRK